MKHLTFSVIGGDLYCTYDDGEVRLVKITPASEDFILDCALIIDGLPKDVADRKEHMKGNNNGI